MKKKVIFMVNKRGKKKGKIEKYRECRECRECRVKPKVRGNEISKKIVLVFAYTPYTPYTTYTD